MCFSSSKVAWCLQACKADDLVFKERPLVGAQHTANKSDALVCSACFSMIGSIEQQIAHRLLAREENGTSLRCLTPLWTLLQGLTTPWPSSTLHDPCQCAELSGRWKPLASDMSGAGAPNDVVGSFHFQEGKLSIKITCAASSMELYSCPALRSFPCPSWWGSLQKKRLSSHSPPGQLDTSAGLLLQRQQQEEGLIRVECDVLCQSMQRCVASISPLSHVKSGS